MPEQHEVDGQPVVYDHETAESRGGRRRRPVADWGVGEEMFDRLPRRRFGRGAEPHRRDSHPRERQPAPIATPLADLPAPGPVREHRVEEPKAAAESRVDSLDGRRMVVISGRPGDSATPAVRRPRAPRTVGERVSHRPDRIAMWAVALGMLLILIAILTAGA
jgi:hypothetical protein